MPPASDADSARLGLERVQAPIEDERADMNRPFAALLDANQFGSLAVGHVTQPTSRSAHFLIRERRPVHADRIPFGHTLADRHQVRSRRAEDDALPDVGERCGLRQGVVQQSKSSHSLP